METTFTRIPFANAVIIVVTSIIFFLPLTGIISFADLEPFALKDWDLSQLIGSAFLHGGFFHLLGNMLFLWIFGNAICGAVGNAVYPFLYLFLAILSGASHLIIDGTPAIGASGAINGIVGMTLVFFPKNRIHTFYWFFIPIVWFVKTGKFETKAIWMILFWLIFDIFGAMIGGDGVAHWAHIGGFLGGVTAGLILLQFHIIDTYSPSLLDVLSGKSSDPDAISSLNLDTLAALESPQISSNAMTTVGQQESDALTAQAPRPIEVPVVPNICLSRCVGDGGIVTCYIVNKGATLKNPILKVPQGVTALMSSKIALRTGESGWIRFSTDDESSIDSIEFILGYKNVSNDFHKMRFRCIPISNTLTMISSTEAQEKYSEQPSIVNQNNEVSVGQAG
jgi:membrane associated rhomboid family serine protease